MAKISLIGGGSVQWMPTIVRDLAVNETLAGSRIVLEDIEPAHLDYTLPMARRILEQAGTGCTVEATTDQRAALDGADYVVLTISTGGLDTMRHDLEIPERYGVYQSVGDTVGPGGISRALRNIPVVVGIARDMQQLCPDAWLLNYTNPLSTLCRCVTRTTGVRVIGLCHEIYGCLRLLRRIFGEADAAPPARLEWRVAGINHLIFLVELRLDGEDAFPRLREYVETHPEVEPEGVSRSDPCFSFQDRAALKFELFKLLGVLPAAGDRHLAEFFPYFLTEQAGRGSKYGVTLTRIKHRQVLMEQAFQRADRLRSGQENVAMVPSVEAASRIIGALAGGDACTDVMNLPNAGQIAELPAGAIVETRAAVTRGAVTPEPVGALLPAVRTVLEHHVRIQEMIVEAALSGDRDLALQAFLLDPLIRDLDAGGRMFDELLDANRDYLPQFSPSAVRSVKTPLLV
jgi:alpha-galactosidase/6-phospho-beta-glucosidase family protein